MFIEGEIGNQILGLDPGVFAVSDHIWRVYSENGVAIGTPDQGTGGFDSAAV